MKLRALSLVLILLVAIKSAEAARTVTLVKDGHPACTIVIAREARKAARFGACELQWHIKQMTEVQIPIVSETGPIQGIRIDVGESDALKKAAGFSTAGLKTQEYVVSVKPGRIILAGKDSDDKSGFTYNMDDPVQMAGFPDMWSANGSLYAVYDFLERCGGVRWFNQTESGTFIPEAKDLAVPCGKLRRRPAFRYRNAWHLNPQEYDAYVSLWPVLWRKDTPQFREWDAMAYAGLHEKYKDDGQYNRARGNLSQLYLLRNRNGGDRLDCNHSLYGYYARFWEKNPNVPGAFVERRPNYFAKGYGQGPEPPPQLCYTDPGLIQQVARDAADYYDGRKTGQDLVEWFSLPNPFPVEPMDNAAFCKCANCAKFFKKTKKLEEVYSVGTQSDYFFNFVNEVCKELRKTHPDKGIITLAYNTHARVPSFKLDPGVNVQYCFVSNRAPYDPLQYNNDLANLAAWVREKKKSGRQLGLWLYYNQPWEWAGNGNYHCFPGFFAHTIAKQMKLFQKCEIYGMTYCGYGQEVEAYVTFRLMNDPSLDVDQVLDEYFRLMYGNAAQPMKQLYNRIEETYTKPENYIPNGKADADFKHPVGLPAPQIAWGILGTEERMTEFGRLMEAAEKSAATEMQRHRVALFKKAVWEYMTMGAATYRERTNAAIPSLQAPEAPDANGDATLVDWSKAIPLGGTWFKKSSSECSDKKLSGRLCHDGKFLYLELADECDTSKLVTSPTIFPYDDWEIFVAAQRALPYRHFAVNPAGQVVATSNGEINWRMNVPIPGAGLRAVSNVSAPDRWVTRLAIPMASLTATGVPANGKFCLNVLRVSSPRLTGRGAGIDTWVSHTTVHEVARLAEVTLAW